MICPEQRILTVFGRSMCAGLVLAGMWPTQLGPGGLQAAELTNSAPLSIWDTSARLEVGGGYRDNVLRTAIAPESSALISVAGDASLMRLSETGSELTLFVLGQNDQYLDAPSVGGERFASASAQYRTPVGVSDTLGAELNYLYQNQVLDVSETEALLQRVPVQGHSAFLRPHWKHTFTPRWATQLEVCFLRQFYVGDLDDFSEPSAKLSLTYSYGRKSDISLGFQSLYWIYDTREQTDAEGMPIPDTKLYYWRPEVFAQWRNYWDEQKRWQTTTRVGWLWNRDNGSGYYDYERFRVAQHLRWKAHGWDVTLGARYVGYLYRLQEVESEKRERSYVTLDLRVERRLAKRWYAFAVAETDRNFSNDPLDEYDDWMAGGGLGVEF